MQKRMLLERKFEIARRNLLSVVIFSAINVLLVLANTNLSFLFSATFPLFVAGFGQAWTQESGEPVFLLVAAAISIVVIGLYLLFYLLTKKRKGAIIGALVLFSLDTLFLVLLVLPGFDFSVLINVAFHIWIMYYLITGTRAWSGLKNLHDDDLTEPVADIEPVAYAAPREERDDDSSRW